MSNLKNYKGVVGEWEVIEFDMLDFKQICIASDAQKNVIAMLQLPDYVINNNIRATAFLMSKSYDMIKVLCDLQKLIQNNTKLSGEIDDELLVKMNKVIDEATNTVK